MWGEFPLVSLQGIFFFLPPQTLACTRKPQGCCLQTAGFHPQNSSFSKFVVTPQIFAYISSQVTVMLLV